MKKKKTNVYKRISIFFYGLMAPPPIELSIRWSAYFKYLLKILNKKKKTIEHSLF